MDKFKLALLIALAGLLAIVLALALSLSARAGVCVEGPGGLPVCRTDPPFESPIAPSAGSTLYLPLISRPEQ